MNRPLVLPSLVCIGLAVTACGSDAPADIDFSALDDAIDDTLDEVDFDDSDGEIDCPVDDWDDIVEATVEGLEENVFDDALDGEREERAFEAAGERNIDCSYFDDDTRTGVGLFLLEVPRDPDEFAEEFAGEDARVDIDVTNEYRGGQFRHVCAEYRDDPEFDYCQVEWIDDDVLVSVYVLGEGAADVDTDALEEAFTPQLDLIAEQFAP